ARPRRCEAAPLVRQMAQALSAAHAHGVLHRDFKSSNVLLVRSSGSDPRVVVTDFGVARAVRDGRELLTETGSYVGTPAYMPPEQASGRRLTPAADVYALGVVVYEMVTGALPFRDEDVGSVRSRGRPPDLAVGTPGLPARWRQAIDRALAPDVEDRCPTPAAFLHLLSGGRVQTVGARRRRRRAAFLCTGFLLSMAAGGGAAVLVRQRLAQHSAAQC